MRQTIQLHRFVLSRDLRSPPSGVDISDMVRRGFYRFSSALAIKRSYGQSMSTDDSTVLGTEKLVVLSFLNIRTEF